jgi:hypothetical protein
VPRNSAAYRWAALHVMRRGALGPGIKPSPFLRNRVLAWATCVAGSGQRAAPSRTRDHRTGMPRIVARAGGSVSKRDDSGLPERPDAYDEFKKGLVSKEKLCQWRSRDRITGHFSSDSSCLRFSWGWRSTVSVFTGDSAG